MMVGRPMPEQEEYALDEPAKSGAAPAADYTNDHGAAVLKSRIEAYWRAHGFDVQIVLVPGPFSAALRAGRVDVRSDLVNGLPRGAARPWSKK